MANLPSLVDRKMKQSSIEDVEKMVSNDSTHDDKSPRIPSRELKKRLSIRALNMKELLAQKDKGAKDIALKKDKGIDESDSNPTLPSRKLKKRLSFSPKKSLESKTDYSDILKTTIKSKESSLSEINSEMSSLDISNTLSEWNTLLDLSKTVI